MDTVLIAIDGSPSAREATTFGLELAADHEATATFVLVVPELDVVPCYGFGHVGAVPHTLGDTEREPLDEALRLADQIGVAADAKLLRGDAVDEIVAYADTIDADLIVVGSRGHGAVTNALLGSVSHGILREAHRPVLVVRGTAARRPAALAAV